MAPPASNAAKPMELIQRSQSNPSAKSTTAATRGGGRPRDAQEPGGQDPRPHRADVRKAAAGAVREGDGEDEADEDRERLVAGSVDHPLEARSERVAEVGEHRSVTFDLGRRRAHECRDGLSLPRPATASTSSATTDGTTHRPIATPLFGSDRPRARADAATTSTNHGPTISGLASLKRVDTPSNIPPTRPITIGFARVGSPPRSRSRPTGSTRTGPAGVGPPTVSRPNGATTSSAAAAYAMSVRCRQSSTTRAIAPTSMMAATTFWTKSTMRSDGVWPTAIRRISPASPRRTKPYRYVTYHNDRPYSLRSYPVLANRCATWNATPIVSAQQMTRSTPRRSPLTTGSGRGRCSFGDPR